MPSLPADFHIWEGVYESFTDASSHAGGPGFQGDVYSARAWAAARECLDALEAGNPIPPFHKQRSTLLPVVASIMLESCSPLRILDFGGGLGIGYMTLVESLEGAASKIRYDIVEIDEVCKSGDRLLGGRVTYMSRPPVGAAYNLVHSASALQYLENWRAALRVLGTYGAEYVLLSDVFAGPIPTFVSLQNYYGSRIPQWFWNFDDVMDAVAAVGYRLIMKSHVSARRLETDDVLPMDNFPRSHRLDRTLHLLLKRSSQ